MLTETTKRITESLLLNSIFTFEYRIDSSCLDLNFIDDIYKHYTTNSLIELHMTGFLRSSDNIFDMNDISLKSNKHLVLDVENLITKEFSDNIILNNLIVNYPLTIKNEFERGLFLSKLYNENNENMYLYFKNYHYTYKRFINRDISYIKNEFKYLLEIHNILFNRLPIEFQVYRNLYSKAAFNTISKECCVNTISTSRNNKFNIFNFNFPYLKSSKF